jgi:hypothetical protein
VTTAFAWQGGCLFCGHLEYGGAFIILVGAIVLILLIGALVSLAERGGFSWLQTNAGDRGQAERREGVKREDRDDVT